MNKTINPSNLSKDYIKKISESDPRKKVRLRANILLEYWEGKTETEIVQKLNCCLNNVKKWIQKWINSGIGPIVTWRQTISWKKQIKRRSAVEKLMTSNPVSYNLPFTTWSLQKAAAFFRDILEYQISPSTIFRDCRLLKISYKSVKDTFIIKSPDYDVKRAWLRFIKHYCPEKTRIIYVDEKGPVHVLRYLGKKWSFLPEFRDIRQKSEGKVQFLGGYDPLTKDFEMIPMEEDSSYAFCQCMDMIRLEFLTQDYNYLIVVFDNDPIHCSYFTKEFFDKDPQMDCFFLPTYSPELNPIERVFENYTREYLDNRIITSVEQLIGNTRDYVTYYNTLRREIYA